MRIRIANIKAKVDFRPPGYLHECLSRGHIEGEWIVFSDENWRYLCRRYRMLEPSREDMAANYIEATQQAKARGFEIVPEEEYKRRLEICETCEHYMEEHCAVCGNNPIRLYWKHAKCQHGKWNNV